jgi:mannosyltransferase OCH1-like enzyme
MIPKITHQIWFQGWDELPMRYMSDVEKLENMNKDWEHMKWDEESLRSECVKFSPEALTKFDGFDKMIQKIDFGRYIVLHNYGGVSVDCDVECLRPLDKIPGLTKYDLILGKNSLSRLENKLSSFGLSHDLVIVNNATLCCSKENSIIHNLVKFLIKNESWNEDDVFDTQLKTGPLMLSVFFNKYIDDPDVNIVDSDVFEPWGNITRRTILNHKYDLSWTQYGSIPVKIYRTLKNNLLLILIFILVLFTFFSVRGIAIRYSLLSIIK